MPPQEIDELFAQALRGDDDDREPWEAIHALRRIGTREVFDRAAKWCKSTNPIERARGAAILAQLGRSAEHPSNNFPEESFIAVSRMLAKEKEVRPLGSAIHALGHLENPKAVPLIVAYRDHQADDVRFAAACALGAFPNHPASVQSLLHLTSDADHDVRDWAVFGLGVLGDSDSPEIRDAMAARLNDSFEDARDEAMVSLAKRKDVRVLPVLTAELKAAQEDDSRMTTLVTEAACLMLGMEQDQKDWIAADYLTALQKRFSL
ncbi:MAG TPA: HEAT repeat domain-containing protein [Candidatus Angelobacter sp.]|nr:HEAT repeat domain-containing protein [Candidatus Angelobacter sp.]